MPAMLGDAVQRRSTASHEMNNGPSSPDMGELSTPKMSQHVARSLLLDTPPLILNAFHSPKSHLPFAPSFDSDHTPISLEDNDRRFDPLEPPAWRPPQKEEIDYVEDWNNTYNNQHNFFNGYKYFKQDDSSTICSSQTNNSINKSIHSREKNPMLRSRGFSIHSYGSHSRCPSFGSCPQQHRRQGTNHHRYGSFPVALLASPPLAHTLQYLQSSEQSHTGNHPLLETETQRNRTAIRMISPKRNGPYEIHSHRNASQVMADATLAGLHGPMLEMYRVDRCVDEAAARMSATEEKGRATSIGTLGDVRAILELHRVDKMVDKFKLGLQMPVFLEEVELDAEILRELRRVDLEMEECRRGKTNVNEVMGRGNDRSRRMSKNQIQYQFDLSEDEEEDENWDMLGGDSGDIYLSNASFLSAFEWDPYQFYDPHESDAVISNTYQPSLISATHQDDLHEIIDLLRSDIEIDGVSRRTKDMDIIRSLLEMDQKVERRKIGMKRKISQADFMALYLIDIEVDNLEGRGAVTEKSQELKIGTELDGGVPIVVVQPTSQSFDPLHRSAPGSTPLQESDLNADIGSVPLPTPGTRRAIFTFEEKLNNKMI